MGVGLHLRKLNEYDVIQCDINLTLMKIGRHKNQYQYLNVVYTLFNVLLFRNNYNTYYK